MLAKLADFSFRRRWSVLLLWIAALALVTVANGSFGGSWRSSGRLDGTDSQRAYDLIDKRFPAKSGATAIVVFSVPEGIAGKQTVVERYLADVKAVKGVTEVGSPFASEGQVSDDGTIAFATVDFAPGTGFDGATAIQKRAEVLKDADVTTEFSGSLFTEGELPASEIFGLIAATVILVIAFGSVLAAGVPLVTAIIGIGIGLGSVGLWAAVVDTPDFTVQVASMIGIGVGIDYALFIVTRFREERARGHDVRSAVAQAASTAGRAVVFAGLTVMVSLLGMILMRLKFLNGLAIGSSTAVAVAVLAATTLLPALLGFVGTRIPPAKQHTVGKNTFWDSWSRIIQRRALPAAAIGTMILVALSIPTLSLRLGQADAGSAPTSQTVRRRKVSPPGSTARS
jgi:putative drug exporter of the RND superfamily